MRYIVAFVALLAVVGGLAAIKYNQISSLIATSHAMERAGPPPEAVGSTASVNVVVELKSTQRYPFGTPHD